MTARSGGEAYQRLGAGFRRFVAAAPGRGNARAVGRFASLPALEARVEARPVLSVDGPGPDEVMVATPAATPRARSRSGPYRMPALALAALLVITGVVVGAQRFSELVLLGIDGRAADPLAASATRLSYPFVQPYRPPTAEKRAFSLAVARTPAVLDEPLQFEALRLMPAGSLGVALASETDHPLEWRAPIMRAPIAPRVVNIPISPPRIEVVEAPPPPQLVTPVRNSLAAGPAERAWDPDRAPRVGRASSSD